MDDVCVFHIYLIAAKISPTPALLSCAGDVIGSSSDWVVEQQYRVTVQTLAPSTEHSSAVMMLRPYFMGSDN